MKISNPLGVHFTPTHTGDFHYKFIRDMQPGIFKLVGSSTPDVQQMADGYEAAPNALHYWRNVARSEQHDFLWRDPVGAAIQHAQEWDADIQERYRQARERKLTLPDIEQVRILGINEPVMELFSRNEDMSNYDVWLAMMNERAPKLDSYMHTFGVEANRLGYGTGLGNISSGQPANKKPGLYATFDWFPKTRKLLESTRGLNAYACHEYWRAETGPEGHADWHAWRFMHLDIDCDIDVLESGVDQKITSADMNGNRGYRGHMDSAAYIDQHRRYFARARTDSRFRGATPFSLDGDNMWESFWIEYCMAEMVALSNELRATPAPSTPPATVHIPTVSTGPKPQESTVYVAVPDGANIRDYPKTGNVLLAVPYGEPVTLYNLDTETGWARVRYQDAVGWILWTLLSDKPVAVPEPTPEQPVGDNWTRSLAYVRRWEGGYVDHPSDPGGATNKGITIGTFTRWRTERGLPTPTVDDLRAISDEEVSQIYHEWYWKESGADKLQWPLCLAHFDTSVNAGPGRAAEMLQTSGGDFLAYMGHLIAWYTRINGFEHFGRAWIRRRAEILLEASK